MRMCPVPVKREPTAGGWNCAWARGRDGKRWRRSVRVERWRILKTICGGDEEKRRVMMVERSGEPIRLLLGRLAVLQEWRETF